MAKKRTIPVPFGLLGFLILKPLGYAVAAYMKDRKKGK